MGLFIVSQLVLYYRFYVFAHMFGLLELKGETFQADKK